MKKRSWIKGSHQATKGERVARKISRRSVFTLSAAAIGMSVVALGLGVGDAASADEATSQSNQRGLLHV